MASAAEITVVSPEVEARRFSRLWWLASSALVPWMLISFVTIMAFGTPNVIITPIMWMMLVTIWSYPLVVVTARVLAALFHRYGLQQKATMALAVPGAIGAFLFGMLVTPVVLFPVFTDGYFALMGSCLLSIMIAGSVVRWMLR